MKFHCGSQLWSATALELVGFCWNGEWSSIMFSYDCCNTSASRMLWLRQETGVECRRIVIRSGCHRFWLNDPAVLRDNSGVDAQYSLQSRTLVKDKQQQLRSDVERHASLAGSSALHLILHRSNTEHTAER